MVLVGPPRPRPLRRQQRGQLRELLVRQLVSPYHPPRLPRDCKHALTLARDGPDPLGAALALNGLGLLACDRGDRTEAAARFSEGLQLWRQLGTRARLADWLAGVGTLAATSQAAERAARFFGAAEAVRDVLGHHFVLPERSVFERVVGVARAALGEAAFAEAWAAGLALPLEQALTEASAFLSSVVAPTPPAEPRAVAASAPPPG